MIFEGMETFAPTDDKFIKPEKENEMKEGSYVTIKAKDYAWYCRLAGRVESLIGYLKTEEYSPNRKMIYAILGREEPNKEDIS